MQRLCRLPGRCGRRRKLCGPLVSSLETGRPRLASRPRISGGRREKKKKKKEIFIIQLFLKHTRTHTRDRQITTLRIYKLTIKSGRLYTFVWDMTIMFGFFLFLLRSRFIIFSPLAFSLLSSWCGRNYYFFFVFFLLFFPSPLHVTLFLQQRTFKDRSL